MKTVLITGCSSGYGLETARHFHAQGWNVVATMRTPREEILPRSERMRVLPLDVTRSESISSALDASGPIDVLVNNAGIGVVGAFEATPLSHVRRVFETNTFGVMAMTQAVIPQFRNRRSGVVVNVTFAIESSISLQKTFPRTNNRSKGLKPIPASPPVSRSALKSALAFVTTFPTRKLRYSSLSVGARKARYADALTSIPVSNRFVNQKRGLNAVSVLSGNRLCAGAPITGVRFEKPWLLSQ